MTSLSESNRRVKFHERPCFTCRGTVGRGCGSRTRLVAVPSRVPETARLNPDGRHGGFRPRDLLFPKQARS